MSGGENRFSFLCKKVAKSSAVIEVVKADRGEN